MPRPKLKISPEEFSIDVQRAKVENSQKCIDLLNEVAISEPSIDSLSANQTLSWAFSLCPIHVVQKSIQLIKDVGHLGSKILKRCINYLAVDDSECSQMTIIAPFLLVHRNALLGMASATPLILATPNQECACGEEFADSECKFSKIHLYQPLGSKPATALRIYCRSKDESQNIGCSRVNYPFSAEKHNKTALRKALKNAEVDESDGEDGLQERQYYNYKQISFVMGNRANYFSTKLCEMFANCLAHAWVSVEGFTEAYNEAQHNLHEWQSPNHEPPVKLMDRKVLGRAFTEHEIWRDLIETASTAEKHDTGRHSEVGKVGKMRTMARRNESKRRAKATTDSETQKAEASMAQKSDCSSGNKFPFTLIRGLKLEQYLRSAQFRDRGIYLHKETSECESQGCKWMDICDGNWKLQYPLCMFQELRRGLNGALVSMNCKLEPFRRRAFCEQHCSVMANKGFPIDVRQFMEACRSKKGKETAITAMLDDFSQKRENAIAKSDDPDKETAAGGATNGHSSDAEELLSDDDSDGEMVGCKSKGPLTRAKAKQQVLTDVQQKLESVAEVRDDNSLEGKLVQVVDIEERSIISKCFKNTGSKKRMNQWLRGHFIIVKPCGHIARWEPLYGSESPSQAFLIMMEHLKLTLPRIDESQWHKYSLVYDNMCNVAGMKIAQNPLPTKTLDGEELFPEWLKSGFLKINKAIDNLHFSNHVDPICKKKYDPASIEKLHPDISINTMRAEETFVWLSRFKKILCAQPKTHHHFYLHRLITRRNRYTFWYLTLGKRPKLPKVTSIYTK